MFFILVFIPFAPILIGSMMLGGSDVLWGLQALASYKDALNRQDSFLWNPSVFSGFPTFISSFGLLSPVHWIFLNIFSAITAYGVLTFLGIAMGGFFAAFFLRTFGAVTWSAAFLGAVSWMISFQFHVQRLSIVYTFMFLPLLFLAVWKIYDRKRWAISLGIAIIALEWLMGHWHWVIESLIAVGLFALYLNWREIKEKTKFNFSQFRLGHFRILVLFILVAVIGSLIGTIQLAPTLLYMGLSERGAGFSHWEASASGLNPFDVFAFFFPFFDVSFLPPTHELYIGIIALFFALVVFSLRRSDASGFFSWLFVFSFVMAISYSPVFWFLHHFPPFLFSHFPSRWMFIGGFALSMLAGLGFDYVLRIVKTARHDTKVKRAFWIFSRGISLLGLIFAGLNIIGLFFKEKFLKILFYIFDAYFFSGTNAFPPEYYHAYIAKQFSFLLSAFSFFDYRMFISFLFILGSYVFLRYIASDKFSLSLARISGLFIAVASFLFVYTFSSDFAYVSRKSMLDYPPTIAFIKSQAPGRFFSMSFSDYYIRESLILDNISLDEGGILESALAFPADRALLWGLESIRYYDNLVSWRMARVVNFIDGADIRNAANIFLVGNQYAFGGAEEHLRREVDFFEKQAGIVNFLGIRYLISFVPLDEKLFMKRFEAPLTSFKIPAMVYENKNARPRFYFADSVETIHENEEAAFEKLKTIPEKGLGVFIECPAVAKSQFQNPKSQTNSKFKIQNSELNSCDGSLLVDGQGQIEIKTKKNTVSILKTKSGTPQFLVFSENNLPGWKAYIDGKNVPIYIAGSVYMGIAVPEGEHAVMFEYTYRNIIEEFWRNYSIF